jgi:hypothetical protein
MDLPAVSEPPWTFVEWLVTGISTLTVSAAAFVWRLMARLERLSTSVDRQRLDLETHKDEAAAATTLLSERLAQLHEDHHRLREIMGSLPRRTDLRDLEVHIGERIEALAARFDRAIEKRGL